MVRKLNTQKWERTKRKYREQNKTEYKKISILLLQRQTFKKTPKNKGENTRKPNLKRRGTGVNGLLSFSKKIESTCSYYFQIIFKSEKPGGLTTFSGPPSY